MADLSKYLRFQKKHYNTVYLELSNQYYNAGWVDYILPRLEEQCDSQRSYGSGFNSQKEVRSFWNTKLLRENYINIIKLLNKLEDINIISNRGKFKIKQSINLFLPLANEEDKILLSKFLEKLTNIEGE